MASFDRRSLGRTGLEVTTLGFGGVQVGDHFVLMPDRQATDALATAWDCGIRYFDTAPLYGRGLSERRVGNALRGHQRGSFVLSTKVGRILVPDDGIADDPARRGLPFRTVYDYSYDGVRRSIEDSLQRLGLSRIDLVFLHDLEPRAHGDDYPRRFREAADGGVRALAELRSQRVIRGFGAGLNEADAAVRLIEAADLDCLMLAGRYTLLEQQTLDDVLPLAERRGVAIVIGAPFNSGVLATGAMTEARYNNRPLEPELRARVEGIEAVCAAHGVPLPAAALQFPLAHPTVASVVAGMATADEVRRNVDLITQAIPPDFWAELKARNLIRADAPTP